MSMTVVHGIERRPETARVLAAPSGRFVFGDFRFDVAEHRLWRRGREIRLRPKSWDLLHHLVTQPGVLVTKEALHRKIWPDTAVSDDALTRVIGELRRALGDSVRTPRYIETVHGRGFRFVAMVQEVEDGTPEHPSDRGGPPFSPAALGLEPPSLFVGRQPELHRLHECLHRARQGERQLVFITGEAGIGKTALAEAFLRTPAARGPDVHVLHGQCVQQHGGREPYMPVLEALERLLRAPAGSPLIPLCRRVAPCWCAQIPWLLADGPPAGFQAAMLTAPPERMLREVGALVDAVAMNSTIVLLLEDLHWSDNATLDLIAFLAQRRDPARLLILGTYRPAEASAQDHPVREVKRTLRARRRCIDLALGYLSTADVRGYLRARFGDAIQDLAPLLHERTDGNPLFVVAIVEELIRRGDLTRAEGGWVMAVTADRRDLPVPEDLREMVLAQFQRLGGDERSVLEAASVVGVNFAPSLVARALGREAEDVDAAAQHMTRAHLFLNIADDEARGPGTRYEFSHALHQQLLYEQIPALRRQRLHLAVGEALESTAGERLAEIAPELSVHFEQGGDFLRAATYLGVCVARAQQRQASHEAIASAELALDLLGRVPDSPSRRQRELDLRLLLGVSLTLTRGYSAPGVRDNYERARALCEDTEHARQLFEIIQAVWYAQNARFEFDAGRESAAELARIAHRQSAPDLILRAELARGRVEFWSGHLVTALQISTRFLEAVSRQPLEVRPGTPGLHPVVAAFVENGLARWFLGHPDQARAQVRKAITYAEESQQPFSLASALAHAMFLEFLCGNAEETTRLATSTASVCTEHGVSTFGPLSRFFAGVARAAQGDVESGLSEMLPALAEHREAIGPLHSEILVGAIATAYGQARQWDEGLRWVDEGFAITEAVREHLYAAELWRIKGDLLLGKARGATRRKTTEVSALADAARHCFRRARAIARKQQARALELRSLMSLARLSEWRDSSRTARRLLRALLASFTEGFDTKDLQEAKAILDSSEPARRAERASRGLRSSSA
jgi:DNA-binding winged helix-turn-helix (wHTH) protein